MMTEVDSSKLSVLTYLDKLKPQCETKAMMAAQLAADWAGQLAISVDCICGFTISNFIDQSYICRMPEIENRPKPGLASRRFHTRSAKRSAMRKSRA